MKYKLWIPLIVMIFLLSACGSVPVEQSAQMPTSEISGVGEVANAEPTQLPDKKMVSEYMDEFNAAMVGADWSEPYVVTTKALPGKGLSKVSIQGGWLAFNLDDEETYLYEFYQNPTEADTLLEVKFVPGGNHTVNGVSLVCRATDDFSKWYEFRLSDSNKYNIYYYDRSIKEDKGKNPYVSLVGGATDAVLTGRENIFRAMCKGSTLVMELNGTQLASVDAVDLTESGMAGVGAMSFNLTPTIIKFDYFSISKP